MRDLSSFITQGRKGGGRGGGRNLQTEKYKNNDCTYHIFNSSSISSNRGLAPRTSVIVVQSHFLFTCAISKQAKKQLVPDLFLSALDRKSVV